MLDLAGISGFTVITTIPIVLNTFQILEGLQAACHRSSKLTALDVSTMPLRHDGENIYRVLIGLTAAAAAIVEVSAKQVTSDNARADWT